MRIMQPDSREDLKRIMREIRVDPYGIKIMLPKATGYLVRINSVSCIAANILKQEMLSLGGDVAVARGALTARLKKTDCLIMGNLSQFIRLTDKLRQQPFGLGKMGREIRLYLDNYQRNNFILDLNKYKLNLCRRRHIMGIINLTPDSFSGDGLYKTQYVRHKALADARRSNVAGAIGNTQYDIIEYARHLVRDGADIIDIGGESSRPGAKPVSVKEELRRVIPAIRAIAKKVRVPISIDTYKPEVARQALDNGAVMVNDISGLRNPKMLKVVARYKAGAVIMHMKGRPATMQNNPHYKSLIDEIVERLDNAINSAVSAGIDRNKIVIDPGIGFGKSLNHNLEILKRLKEFRVLGRPILVGPSRKSFIGKILNVRPQQRIFGSVSACVLAAVNGASIVRAHDVKAVSQAFKILDNINR